MNNHWSKDIKGQPLIPIVRIKPATNFQREDLRINNQHVILTDPNNRILYDAEVPECYGWEVPLESIYLERIAPHIDAFLQGINLNIFAYGSTGAGKSQTIEGNKKEKGVIMLYVTTLFANLANKTVQSQLSDSQITDYKYEVKMQYVEILDENIVDLLAERRHGVRLFVEDDMWEGPIVKEASWHTITEDVQLIDKLLKGLKNRDNTSNEFGKVSAKATSYFAIDLKQSFKQNDEQVMLKSQTIFIDLPGSEVLIEDPETVRIKQGSTLNKIIIAFTQLVTDLANRQSDYVMFDTSTVTRLGKEMYGGNGINIGIFCLQHGDPKGSQFVLKTFMEARRIISYPVVNNDKMIALFRQFRQEASSSKGVAQKKDTLQDGSAGVQELLDLKRQVNEQAKQLADMDDELQDLRQKLSGLRMRFQELVRQKAELQEEIIRSEEEKLENARAMLDLQLQQEKLNEIINNLQYDQNSKLLNGDQLAANLKEQQAQALIKELQERLQVLLDEKSEIELEFMALKKNYIEKLAELEQQRLIQENYSLELINVANENKALQEEINKLFQTHGSTSEENKLFLDKIEKLQSELRDKDETLIFAKAEIERLKVELMRFDVLGQQGKVDGDKIRMGLDKSRMVDTNNKPINANDDVYKNERMLWDSQKMELTHKVKSLQRRVGDDNERIKELEKQINELMAENNKMQLQLDEMRAIYRNKLIQIHKLDPRDELFQTYAAKEKDLSLGLEALNRKIRQQTLELRSIRSYSRNIRYLAEDWAPIGQPLPDILMRDYPLLEEEQLMSQLQKDQEQEITRIRNRNHQLEAELMTVKERIKQDVGNDTSRRLITEIQSLKQSQVSDTRPDSNWRKERTDLQEENRRLVQLLKDSNKWDVNLMQRENDRLLRMLKEYEMIGPQSGQSKNIQQKIGFYEQLTKQLERDRTELMVKATMAEEQLLQMQSAMTRITSDYQKQINELKKQLKRL